MSRGGARDNAGRKSGWVNLETKLIRIPVAIESQLMAIAKKLDRGESIELETKSIEVLYFSKLWGLTIPSSLRSELILYSCLKRVISSIVGYSLLSVLTMTGVPSDSLTAR